MDYWILNEKQITSLNDLPEDIFGFVYLITNLDNGKKYIGKKQIFSNRKVKLSKRQLERRLDKRSSIYKTIKKESNWLIYTGSNEELSKDVRNGANIKREILKICYTKRQLTYFETKFLFTYGVIESDEFYNQNILGKFYTF